jgi:hypothetical protein
MRPLQKKEEEKKEKKTNKQKKHKQKKGVDRLPNDLFLDFYISL